PQNCQIGVGPTIVREPRPNRLLPVVGLSARSRISSLRGSIRRRCPTARLLVLGPVSVDELCPTYLPGWPAGHRGMSAISGRQALSHGLSREGVALPPGRCQRLACLRIFADFAQLLI